MTNNNMQITITVAQDGLHITRHFTPDADFDGQVKDMVESLLEFKEQE